MRINRESIDKTIIVLVLAPKHTDDYITRYYEVLPHIPIDTGWVTTVHVKINLIPSITLLRKVCQMT